MCNKGKKLCPLPNRGSLILFFFVVDTHCFAFCDVRDIESYFCLQRRKFFYYMIDNIGVFCKTLLRKLVYDSKVPSKAKQSPERPPTCGYIKLK